MAIHTSMRGLRSMSVRLRAGVRTGREVTAQMRQAVCADSFVSWRRPFLPGLSTTTHDSLSCIAG
jgi:hypothetical protein